jgi:hypothetical protein
MTAGELRAQLRAQQARNNSAEGRNSGGSENRGNATAGDAVAGELRDLVSIILADDSEADRAEALAVALADPEAALHCFRAMVAEREATAPLATIADPWMRTCRQCLNLSPGGRCLAAWRGESFGDGLAVGRNFAPLDPDRLQRCAGYSPGPDDPNRRTGVQRWPWLIAPGATSG